MFYGGDCRKHRLLPTIRAIDCRAGTEFPAQFMKCDSCKTDGHYKLRSIGDQTWVCKDCVYYEPKEVKLGLIKRIRLGSQMATEKQLQELERRRILPMKKPGGGYYLGRMMENGKIAEKWPDYA